MYYILVSCLYYYVCITVPSFYHSLGRFLTTLGLRAQIGDPRTESALESPRKFLIWPIHRYFSNSFQLSYLFLYSISVMITDPLLQVFLYLSHAGPQVFMEVMYCIEA